MVQTRTSGKSALPMPLPAKAAERARLADEQVALARRLLDGGEPDHAIDTLKQALRAGLWRHGLLWEELARVGSESGYPQLRDLWWDSPRYCQTRPGLLRVLAEAADAAGEQEEARVLLRKAILQEATKRRRLRARLGRLKRALGNRRQAHTDSDVGSAGQDRHTTMLQLLDAIIDNDGGRRRRYTARLRSHGEGEWLDRL